MARLVGIVGLLACFITVVWIAAPPGAEAGKFLRGLGAVLLLAVAIVAATALVLALIAMMVSGAWPWDPALWGDA